MSKLSLERTSHVIAMHLFILCIAVAFNSCKSFDSSTMAMNSMPNLTATSTPKGTPSSTSPTPKPSDTPIPSSTTGPTNTPNPIQCNAPIISPFSHPSHVTPVNTLSGHLGPINQAKWSPDQKYIATASEDKTVKIWLVAQNYQLLYTSTLFNAKVKSLDWSPNGNLIAAADANGNLYIFQKQNVNTPSLFKQYGSEIDAVAWSPDGNYIATGGMDGVVNIWQASNLQSIHRIPAHASYIRALSWSTDSRFVASASFDKTVRIWDAGSGKESGSVLSFKEDMLTVAWARSRDDLIAVAGNDNTVSVWNLNTNCLQMQYTAHSGYVQSVAWSQGNTYIASASGGDGTVRIWNATNGDTKTLYDNGMSMLDAEWAPIDNMLVVAGTDTAAYIISGP